jgi:hypothetical protein
LLVYLTLPDLSSAKVEAILRLHVEGFKLGVLVSYTTLARKPEYLRVLALLRARAPG